jgi:hypothetical protein
MLAANDHPVMLIGRNNERIGYDFLADALRADQTFAVDLRRDFVALDIDGRTGWTIDQIAYMMREVAGPVLVAASGRPGHRHIIAACADVQSAESAKSELRRRIRHHGLVNVTVRHGTKLRPPGTRHRLGGRSIVMDEQTDDAFMQLLRRPVTGKPRQPVPSVTSGTAGGTLSRRPLSAASDALLRSGEGLERYASRSEVVSALLLPMVRAGFSFDDALRSLREPSNLGGAPWRSMEAGQPSVGAKVRTNPLGWLHNDWERAQRVVANTPISVESPSDHSGRMWLSAMNTGFEY